MSAEQPAQPPQPQTLQARGERVWVAPVREQDIAPYRLAVEQSRGRLGWWNPVDADDLATQLSLQSRDRRTFLIHALTPEGDHDLVGRVNVTDAVRRRFESAPLGYDAYDPYAGRGLFAEGLRLVLGLLFAPEDAGGMGLHRVQAAVQPGNVRSAGLLRSLGFQREGFSPRMLWLPGPDGEPAWRDMCTYVILREQWPALPYPQAHRPVVVALVNSVSESDPVGDVASSRAPTLARQLAQELGIPLFSTNLVGTGQVLWALLADSPVGGVVQGCFRPDQRSAVTEGLRGAGLDPATVPEVWYLPDDGPPSARPLGLGPTVVVNTGQGIGRPDIVRIALQVAAGSAV